MRFLSYLLDSIKTDVCEVDDTVKDVFIVVGIVIGLFVILIINSMILASITNITEEGVIVLLSLGMFIVEAILFFIGKYIKDKHKEFSKIDEFNKVSMIKDIKDRKV